MIFIKSSLIVLMLSIGFSALAPERAVAKEAAEVLAYNFAYKTFIGQISDLYLEYLDIPSLDKKPVNSMSEDYKFDNYLNSLAKRIPRHKPDDKATVELLRSLADSTAQSLELATKAKASRKLDRAQYFAEQSLALVSHAYVVIAKSGGGDSIFFLVNAQVDTFWNRVGEKMSKSLLNESLDSSIPQLFFQQIEKVSHSKIQPSALENLKITECESLLDVVGSGV